MSDSKPALRARLRAELKALPARDHASASAELCTRVRASAVWQSAHTVLLFFPVASEPDIVNPVAMTFDERGRAWITESLEYPRASAGPGRSNCMRETRVKVNGWPHGGVSRRRPVARDHPILVPLATA